MTLCAKRLRNYVSGMVSCTYITNKFSALAGFINGSIIAARDGKESTTRYRLGLRYTQGYYNGIIFYLQEIKP